MSCKKKREITFLLVVTFYTFTFHVCHAVSLGQREDAFTSRSWRKTKQDSDVQHGNWRVEQVIKGAHVQKVRRESSALPGKPLSYFNAQNLDEIGRNFEPNSLSWAAGNVSVTASGSEDGYQADFTGFHGVQGKVLGPSFHSGQHSSEWSAMRPVVQCDDRTMTFTASGAGFTHLLVDRGGASPISPFQLPPNCGYSVRMSWSNLEMMMPYDACYIIQENGSYVLPMLWWGRPLKLSCPVQSAPAHSPSAPSVFCSSHAMAVQIHGHKHDVQLLGVMVKGGWRPLISEECAHSGLYQPEMFFIPYSAACVTIRDDVNLHLVLSEREYILSCPVDPQLPYIPSRPSSPDSPTTTSPPQLPQYPYQPYPGFQYPQFPYMYPPGPQPARPPQSPPASPPGLQPPPQPFIYPMRPGKWPFVPGEPPKPPLSGLYYPIMPFNYPQLTPAPTPATTRPPGSPYYSQYYFELSYRPAATAAPVDEEPFPPAPPSPPKRPLHAHHEQFDPARYYSPYYPYGPISYPKIDLDLLPPPPPPTTTSMMDPSQPDSLGYPSGHFHPHRHIHFPLPEFSQEPEGPQASCPPHTFCRDRHFPHHSLSLPDYPLYPVSQYSDTRPQTTTKWPTKPSQFGLTRHRPRVQCLIGRVIVFLPFAHPESIQIRDQTKKWLFLSDVSPLCGYMIQMAEGSGVILHFPLPACHSQSRTPRTISLSLRFWDLSTAQYRIAEPQCPYKSSPEIPVPIRPPSATRDEVSPKPKVSCFSHQMTVELPPGPISGIVVKDINGNQANLQDAPKHCGYSAREGEDGRIHLRFQLHSRCHMSVQGKMYIITVVYVTVNGIRERQFSCPVVSPEAKKECNLPREQHLPCGPSHVPQSQCISMGCCFSKHPPACYYPMDECTTDRHFVFSVPASLTEPPLSPAMLVAAGNSTCRPQRVTSDFALFKIPLDGCGARRVVVGRAVIYMVEVVNTVKAISLHFGTITRDSPVRLLVECRFLPGAVLSVGYLVKTPNLGPGVQTQGMFGVQLRIARDADYSSYYPQYHQPLQMLLGKPLYLEVRLLNSPDPSLVLLVHFCVAYPRSARSVWVLLYNGCPNPLDPALQKAVLSEDWTSSPRGQTRRFTISTFQFLPDGEFMDPDEE